MLLAGGASGWLFFHMLAGSWLVIASANALNQVFEREPDSRMARTASRPIPAGRVLPSEGLAVGTLWGVVGLAELALFVNWLTAALGLVSIILYVFAYTPLKKTTHLATAVGAIPGAIPPLAGWVAVRNEIGVEAALLFAIQFFWQFPHFWAIAWLLREDYSAAGFKMLPFPGADGKSTALCALQYSLPLLPLGIAFGLYLSYYWVFSFAAALLSLWVVYASFGFWRTPDNFAAKKLLRVSVLYLPALLLLMVISR